MDRLLKPIQDALKAWPKAAYANVDLQILSTMTLCGETNSGNFLGSPTRTNQGHPRNYTAFRKIYPPSTIAAQVVLVNKVIVYKSFPGMVSLMYIILYIYILPK